MADPVGHNSTQQAPPQHKRCVACKNEIHVDAALCSHCHSKQKEHPWSKLGKVLKWVGGITAVVSLVIAMVNVNGLYRDYQRRRRAVANLVDAGHWQLENAQYQGAWDSYEHALQLDPGHLGAWDGQVQLAMVWLRNIRVRQGEMTFTEMVNRITPPLYRGAAASPPGSCQADIVAHLGYAAFLLFRDARVEPEQVDALYQRALAIEPGNVYANTFLGHWVLWRRGGFKKAMAHFDAAIQSGRETGYVRRMQLSACFNSGDDAKRHTVKIANQMRVNGEAMSASDRRKILSDVYSRSLADYEPFRDRRGDQVMALLTPEEHQATFAYLIEGYNYNNAWGNRRETHRFMTAVLKEAVGDVAGALAVYRELERHSDSQWGWRDRVISAVARLSGEAGP